MSYIKPGTYEVDHRGAIGGGHVRDFFCVGMLYHDTRGPRLRVVRRLLAVRIDQHAGVRIKAVGRYVTPGNVIYIYPR
jgi:hypothetical protein